MKIIVCQVFICYFAHFFRPQKKLVCKRLILSTKSVSSPTEVRVISDRNPTGVGDDSDFGRRWVGEGTFIG